MKKIILSVMALLPLTALAQQPFTVKGDLKALKTGDKVYLVYSNNGSRITDSAMVTNGTFDFKGTVTDPATANLFKNINPYVKGTKTTFMDYGSIYIEPGNIVLSSVDSLKSVKATGTPTNNDNVKLAALLKPFTDKMKVINEEYAAYTPAQKEDKALRSALQERAGKVTDEMTPVSLEFVKNNPNSYLSLTTLGTLSNDPDQVMNAQALFEKLNPALKATKMGQSLAAVFDGAKKTQIGTVTDFAQNDAAGKLVKLSDFKGKYVLVDFWASWCGPCRQENPNVVIAFNKFKDKNFTVLGVSLDGGETRTTKEAWLKAVEDDKLTWTQVSDLQGWQNAVSKNYGIQGIPFNFLVDPTGKIVAKDLRGEELQTKLAEILGGKTK